MKEGFAMETGRIIKNLRNEKRLSQRELAKILHVSQQTVTSWEIGRSDPSSSALEALSDYFNVSADYLLGKTKAKNPESHDFFDVMSFDGQPLDEHDKKLLADIYRTIQANKKK